MSEWLKTFLPPWTHGWLAAVPLVLKVALILLAALALRWLLRRLIARVSTRYDLPPEIGVFARRITGFLVGFGALLLVLRTFGVSGMVLWSAFTGFAAVAAVAFFAAWSVLSNIFCTLLIFTTRPFRLGDRIEILENGEKPGLKGRVIDINMIYTTMQEIGGPSEGTLMQVPNSLFFQRGLRRWPNTPADDNAVQGDG